MANMLKSVGARIRNLRKAKKMSQEQLAERSGLHFTYVGGVERGERNISLQNLEKIARGLGVKMEELFADLGSIKDEHFAQLHSILKDSDKPTAELIVDIAKRVHEWKKDN